MRPTHYERWRNLLKTVDDEIIALNSRLERAHGIDRLELSSRIEVLNHNARYIWLLLNDPKQHGRFGQSVTTKLDQLGDGFALQLERWLLRLDEREAARNARR